MKLNVNKCMLRCSFVMKWETNNGSPESIHLLPVTAVSHVKRQGVLCVIQKNNLLNRWRRIWYTMACCRVNRCCCCLDHMLGVKLLAFFLILMEIVYTILAVQFKPTFVSFITPTNAVGVSVHILLLVAVFRVSR